MGRGSLPSLSGTDVTALLWVEEMDALPSGAGNPRFSPHLYCATLCPLQWLLCPGPGGLSLAEPSRAPSGQGAGWTPATADGWHAGASSPHWLQIRGCLLAPGHGSSFTAVPSGHHSQRSQGLAWLLGHAEAAGRRLSGRSAMAQWQLCSPAQFKFLPVLTHSPRRKQKKLPTLPPTMTMTRGARWSHTRCPRGGRGNGGPLSVKKRWCGAPMASGLSGVAGGPGGAAARSCHPGAGWWPRPGSAWPRAAVAWPYCRAGRQL